MAKLIFDHNNYIYIIKIITNSITSKKSLLRAIHQLNTVLESLQILKVMAPSDLTIVPIIDLALGIVILGW